MKKIIYTIIVLVLLLGGYLLLGNKEDAKGGGPIKIGVSTVLSGDFAAAGENMVNAAKLAVNEVNERGGVNGRLLELVIEDAGWESKTGLSAAQKLINVDGVKYIIGGTSSNGTLAAAPLANQKKVVYLTPVTGGSNIDNAGEYIFRTANSDLLAGRDVAIAMKKLGFNNVGVIAEVTEYTLDFKKSFEETVSKNGGTVVFSEEFQPGTTDFRTLVTKIKSAKPQALLVASQTGVGGAHFMKQAVQAGLNTVYFSDFTFVTNDSAKKIFGSFEGIYFADPVYDVNNQKTKDFFSKYEKTHGKPSLIPFHAASTYDEVMLISKAIEEVGDDSEKVHDWLLSEVKGYNGLMGTYSLDNKGNSDLGFVIKQVKNGQFVELK